MLSVCIITKNEKENLERCLQSLQGLGVEIVVVDTGSTDGTQEKAAEYTDRLFHFTWCDNFAAAKNFAISRASHELVAVIDSDEYWKLPKSEDMEALYRQIRENPNSVGRICRRNTFSDGGGREVKEWINRIFSRNLFHYEGAIHEQVSALDGRPYDTYYTGVDIGHTGYDLPDGEKKKKADRNIRLLKKELDRLRSLSREDKEQIPYLLYQMGKSYYMAGDYDASCDYFSQGLSFDLEPGLEYVIDMVETYGYALLNSGRSGEAMFFENIYAEFGINADFQFLMGLIYMNNNRFSEAVGEFLKAAEQTDSRTAGVNSYLAYYNIGVIYECLEYDQEAENYYQMCGEYGPALERLHAINMRKQEDIEVRDRMNAADPNDAE